jgi:dCMP deaminase
MSTVNIIIGYFPVIHQGVLRFLQSHVTTATQLFLFPTSFTQTFRPLQKDLRALTPEQIQRLLRTLLPELKTIAVIDDDTIAQLKGKHGVFVLPDEDVSHVFAQTYLSDETVQFDSTFLRWDEMASFKEKTVIPDHSQALGDFHRDMLAHAAELAQHSPDWWRQVGAVLVRDGRVVCESYNQHLPHEYAVAMAGDPRANFSKGAHSNLSLALHAEAAVIGAAARQGIATQGATLYVTTFPCPYCAKVVTASGITALYYREGYAMIDGETVLREAGITLTQVL